MYVKVFASILTSTLWALDDATRLVWITLLALADKDGFVRASPSGLARLANVDEPRGREAIAKLSAPDKDSGSQEYEGRRIEAVSGGFLILNYKKYRDLKDAEMRREQVREAVKKHRAKKSNVITGNPEKAQVEAPAPENADADAKKRATTRLLDSMTLRPAERRFLQEFYGKATSARVLDVRTQLSQSLTCGTKYNGSLVHAHDTAHFDDVLGQVCDGPAMRDPNLAIIVVLKKLAETYLEVKSAAEKSTEIQRSTP